MVQALTSRQRILRAMRRQETDFVPVSPRMWKFQSAYYGQPYTLETCLRAKAEFDFDPIYLTGSLVPNFFSHSLPSPDILPAKVKVTGRVEEKGVFRIVHRCFETPDGPLTDCWQVPLKGPYAIINLEYLVKLFEPGFQVLLTG